MRRSRIRWLLVSLIVAAGVATAWMTNPSAAGTREARARTGATGVVEAHALPGDVVVAGPVVLGSRYAVWAEEGAHRLLLRALDGAGQTKTIFATSKAAGVPRGSRWPYTVSTLVAAAGRVAFVELVAPCQTYATDTTYPYCNPGLTRNAWNSATLFVGRPGSIRPVESTGHLCATRPEPLALGLARRGLVVLEGLGGCPPPRFRAVLRGFGGRLIRVLSPRFAEPLAAEGAWAGFPWGLARVRSGRVARRAPSGEVNDIAVGPSGRFAYLIFAPPRGTTCQPTVLGRVVVGRVGGGTRVITTRAESDSDIPAWNALAIAGRTVAFMHAPGPCVARGPVMLARPGHSPSVVPGLAPSTSLAYDGSLLAAIHGNTVQLTRTGCPHPSIPVPPHEPLYTTGPTELLAGLYVQGGAIPPPPCQPEPRGPYAGRVTVSNVNTGRAVAGQSVASGHLARIRLAPGRYTVSGRISGGGQMTSATITIRQGYETRQDVFEDVP